MEELDKNLLPEIARSYKDLKWLSERSILLPKIVSVEKGNGPIARNLLSDNKVYTLLDSVCWIVSLEIKASAKYSYLRARVSSLRCVFGKNIKTQ